MNVVGTEAVSCGSLGVVPLFAGGRIGQASGPQQLDRVSQEAGGSRGRN